MKSAAIFICRCMYGVNKKTSQDIKREKSPRPFFLFVCGQSGFSVVELLIALTLMAFLATSLLTIITAGGGAFQRVLDDKTAQGEARIAISYITVKLRQNSAQGKVSIVPSGSLTNDRPVLKIEGGLGGGELSDHYFIYFEEPADGGTGRLVEKTASAPQVGDPSGTFKIADVSDFHISYADETQSVINIVVVCEAAGERVSREVSITLRAS